MVGAFELAFGFENINEDPNNEFDGVDLAGDDADADVIELNDWVLRCFDSFGGEEDPTESVDATESIDISSGLCEPPDDVLGAGNEPELETSAGTDDIGGRPKFDGLELEAGELTSDVLALLNEPIAAN